MDFNTAVRNAMQGDSESFAFLYDSTYYNMYYLAMKYVKNEQDAEDIVQDSYLKAQLNMGMLHEPEKFNSWLGCIVANTALNFLKKKKPLVFSAVGGEDNNGQSFIYEIQDDNETYQPEQAYSKEEIKLLVREMVDTLSDEQRMCVMMYHFDGQSIRAIADSMGCSENTVKSRLYYGRNALRKKMEALKEKGYQLYTVSPIPFFLYLLRAEKALPETQNLGKMAMDRHSANNSDKNNSDPGSGSNETANNAAQETAAEAARSTAQQTVEQAAEQAGVNAAAGTAATVHQVGLHAFLGTLTGKITAAVLAAVVVGGTVAGAAVINGFGKPKRSSADDTTSKFQRDSDKSTSRVYDADIDNLPDAGSVVVPKDKYQELVAGNLTKEQLEFVLARLPDNYDANTDNTSVNDYINMFCSDIIDRGSEKGFTSPTNNYFYPDFKVDEVNSILASFKDYEITQENYNIGNGEYVVIDGGSDIITLDVTKNSTQANAVIENANYNDIEMKVTFYSELYSDSVDSRMKKRAILTADDDKKYRITKIEVIDDNVDTDNSLKPEPQPEPTVSSEESASSNQNSNTDGDTDKYSMISRSTSSAQTQSQSTTTVVVPQQQDNTTHTSPSENNNNSRQEEEQVPSEPEEEKLEGSVEYKGDYSDVIRGGLNREQLELVLSWIDNQYCNDKVDDSNVMIVLNYFAEDIRVNNNRGFTYNGEDSNKRIILSAKEMNSLLASFSNYDIFSSSLFSTETEYGSYIDGDNYLHLSVSTVDNKASINANITKAEYNDSEMWIHYSGTQGDRTAILINTGGEYHITEVRLY